MGGTDRRCPACPFLLLARRLVVTQDVPEEEAAQPLVGKNQALAEPYWLLKSVSISASYVRSLDLLCWRKMKITIRPIGIMSKKISLTVMYA